MSDLAAEIASIPDRLLACGPPADEAVQAAAANWRSRPPTALFTVARGTSDAAATYVAHAFSRFAGVPVGSFTPSLASMEGYSHAGKDVKALGISQSGASPDLVKALEAFAQPDRWALTNVDGSALEQAADLRIPIGAGAERSVAATKSFACSLYQIHRLAAGIADEPPCAAAACAAAAGRGLEDPAQLSVLETAANAFVLGRGSALALAQEAALKLKELAGLHAEAISSAEVMHGPKALGGPALPVLAFAQPGPVGEQTAAAAAAFKDMGSPVAVIAAQETEDGLPALLQMLASFYAAVPSLARALGQDPDEPRGLAKVTLTR